MHGLLCPHSANQVVKCVHSTKQRARLSSVSSPPPATTAVAPPVVLLPQRHLSKPVNTNRRLVCEALSNSGDESSPSADEASRQQQQQQPEQHNAGPSSSSSSPVGETASQPQVQLSEEQQELQAVMKKVKAFEDYNLLVQSSSSSKGGSKGSSQRKPRGGSTPAEVGLLIGEDPDQIPLLDAAILIAQHAYPDLDAAHVKQQLDDLAAEVSSALPEGVRYPLRVLKEINRVLYKVHGFKGNNEDYYNPDNSCINKVLENKAGIPITLSLVYMEVAARVGLPMAGVNLPAHFMIRPQVEGIEWLVDAFHGGELTALQDAEEVLGRLIGYQVKLDPKFVSNDLPPLSSRAFLLRLLNNLRQIYVMLNMPEEALAIVRYMRSTAPVGVLQELVRDEGVCLYGLGRFSEAVEVLSEFLASGPDPRDAAITAAILDKAKQAAAAAEKAAAMQRGSSSSSSGISNADTSSGEDDL